jgi:hypothetical protein
MPNPNQVQGTAPGAGSPFARYQAEQVQSLPNGYLEAASAQAQMYAGIGKSITEGIQFGKQMKMKEQEIAATNAATAAKTEGNRINEAAKVEDSLLKLLQYTSGDAKERFNQTSKLYDAQNNAYSEAKTELTTFDDDKAKYLSIAGNSEETFIAQRRILSDKVLTQGKELKVLLEEMKKLKSADPTNSSVFSAYARTLLAAKQRLGATFNVGTNPNPPATGE